MNPLIEECTKTYALVEECKALRKTFIQQQAEDILVTFSVGVAQWIEGESDNLLISRADELMYLAKHSGKQCIKG